MSEDSIKRSKKRRESVDDESEQKLTKEETAVAKYLRFGLAEKEGKLSGMVVNIFIASEALDFLMESKWASDPSGRNPQLFSSRSQAMDYMRQLMAKRLFFRTQKKKKKSRKKEITVSSKKNSKKSQKAPEDQQPVVNNGDTAMQPVDENDKEAGGDEEDSTSKKEDTAADDTNNEEKKTSKKEKQRAGKKARVKLEIHEDQLFIDGDEVYVWEFEPTRLRNVFLGLVVLIVIVMFCLFPLWPAELRTGAYYVSISAMGLLGLFLALALFRGLLFVVIWCCTIGRHSFWLFPNLSEDCGFKESFIPFYSHEVNESTKKVCSKTKKKD